MDTNEHECVVKLRTMFDPVTGLATAMAYCETCQVELSTRGPGNAYNSQKWMKDVMKLFQDHVSARRLKEKPKEG